MDESDCLRDRFKVVAPTRVPVSEGCDLDERLTPRVWSGGFWFRAGVLCSDFPEFCAIRFVIVWSGFSTDFGYISRNLSVCDFRLTSG